MQFYMGWAAEASLRRWCLSKELQEARERVVAAWAKQCRLRPGQEHTGGLEWCEGQCG